MPQPFTATELAQLHSYSNAGDTVGYYSMLKDKGYAYASLALDIVRNDGLGGRVANGYLDQVASTLGVTVDKAALSIDLMQADFTLRQDKFNEGPSQPLDLRYYQVRDYHNVVFKDYDLPAVAWTPEMHLRTADDPEAFWDKIINPGSFSIDEYLEISGDLSPAAHQERQQYRDQLFNADGSVNQNTYGNPQWMAENMPASFTIANLFAPELADEVLAGVADEIGDNVFEFAESVADFIANITSIGFDQLSLSLVDTVTELTEAAATAITDWYDANTAMQFVQWSPWFGFTPVPWEEGSTFTAWPTNGMSSADYFASLDNCLRLVTVTKTYIVEVGELLPSDPDRETEGYIDEDGVFHLAPIEVMAATKQIEVTVEHQQWEYNDPLVIDLDGDGIETLSSDQNDAEFDFGNGNGPNHGWLAPDDGFLVFDENGNATVDGVEELFGSASENGFKELETFDSNGDGQISSADDVFEDLLIWRDLNGDGRSSEDELSALSDWGIESISLNQSKVGKLVEGAYIGAESKVTFADGSETSIADVFFATTSSRILEENWI